MRRSIILLLAVVFATACGDSTGPETPEFDGRWTGSFTTVSATIEVNATENSDGAISGSGAAYVATETLAFTITGTHNHPNINFTGMASGYEDWSFSGSFDGDDTVRGRINGSGFNNEQVTLRRQ